VDELAAGLQRRRSGHRRRLGIWLHGQAGTTAALRVGPLGFLAPELSREAPLLMAGQAQR
jgi:hypothetical protein